MSNPLDFSGKVALVTGAAAGMGLATAKAFAEAGANVVLADYKEETVKAAAQKLAAAFDEERLHRLLPRTEGREPSSSLGDLRRPAH